MLVNQIEYRHANYLTRKLVIIHILCAIFTSSKLLAGSRESLLLGPEPLSNFAIWQVITYNFTFVPDGESLLYVAFMLFVFYHFGSLLEWQINSKRYMKLCIAGVLSGAALHIFFSGILPAVGVACGNVLPLCSSVVAIGTIRFRYLKVNLLNYYIPFWIIGAIAIFITLLQASEGFSIVSVLGGFAAGALFLNINRFLKVREQLSRRQIENRVDALLQKIKENGMGSLSEDEKKFLEKASEYMKKKE